MNSGNDVKVRAGCRDRSVVHARAIRQCSVESSGVPVDITKLMNESDIPLRAALRAKRRSSRPSGRVSVVRDVASDVGGECDHFPSKCESEFASIVVVVERTRSCRRGDARAADGSSAIGSFEDKVGLHFCKFSSATLESA